MIDTTTEQPNTKSPTLFTWGYEGWGNAVPDLLAATERVERHHQPVVLGELVA